MSLLSWMGQRIGLGTRFRRFWAAFAGGGSGAGVPVTQETVMQIAAVWRGVRLEAETVSTLPLNIYENPPGGGDPVLVRDPGNAYDAVLRLSPNEDMTHTEFWEAIVGSSRLVGDGYARKHHSAGRLVALELLDKQFCQPFRVPETGALRYRGTDSRNRPFDLPASEIFHLKGFSFGTDEGLSVVQYGALSLGTVIAGNETSAKIFRSGLSTAGFIETAQVLNEGDRDKLEKIFERYQGTNAPDKLMILEGGMKYNRLSMTSADAQLLSQLQFGIEEIGRWLGMPPILLGHSAGGVTQWGSGIESIIQAWLQLGLRAQLKRIEDAIWKRVIEPADRARFFVKFNIDGLLRGDSAAQAALFGAAAQNGWLTRNEIRRLLDLPAKPGGDELTVQVNMALLKDLGATNPALAQQAKAALESYLDNDEVRRVRNNPQITLNQTISRRPRERTTITKHDNKGRVLEFVREEIDA